MAKELVAGNGKTIVVDADWYDELAKYPWRIDGSGYAEGFIGGKYHKIHRVILAHQLFNYFTVHHKNGNKLDNRLCNLAVMTNSMHSKMHGFKRKK